MHKKRLGIIFSLLSLASGVAAWLMVTRAIEVSGSSIWTGPTLVFGLLLIVLFGAIVFVKHFFHLMLLILAIGTGSLFFGASLWQVPHILFGSVLVMIGAREVRRELDLNIKVDIIKSFHSGKSYVVFGLIWIIAAHYFFIVDRMGGEKIVPKFEVGKEGGQFIMRSIAVLNPSFAAIKNDEVSVDEFILGSQFFQAQPIDENSNAEQIDSLVMKQFLEKNKQAVLTEGRRQLSEMTGETVTGNEKMYDIFAGFINKKLNDYFNPNVVGGVRSSVLPTILAVVLFLTLWPIGSVLGYICVLMFTVLFMVLRKYSWIIIKVIPAEREIIE